MKLNIGCGTNYECHWINTDVTNQVKADHYFDAGKDKWPFPDNVFDEAKSQMVFEHLPDYTARMHFIKELYRVCKPNAKVLLVMPHFSCHSVWQDMQHVRGFGSRSFDNVSKNRTNAATTKYGHEVDGNNNMFFTSCKIKFGKALQPFLIFDFLANYYYTRPIYEGYLSYIFPAQEVHFNLDVIKDEV